jgi:hypothetical protein
MTMTLPPMAKDLARRVERARVVPAHLAIGGGSLFSCAPALFCFVKRITNEIWGGGGGERGGRGHGDDGGMMGHHAVMQAMMQT